MGANASATIRLILERHADETAFLWLLRDAAASAPIHSLRDLVRLDLRVESHIDGLRIAGEAAWEICTAILANEEGGEVFTAAVLALESGEAERIRSVYEVVGSVPETQSGLISAFGWVDRAWWRGQVADLLGSGEVFWRRIGLAASATQRADPGRVLVEALQEESPELRATALRVAGVLGRDDLLPVVLEQIRSDDAAVRFHAACAATLLGDGAVAPREALSFVETGRPREAERALRIALRALPLSEALPWIGRLARQPGTLRHAVAACGIIGDPEAVPWLLEQMHVPELARAAGESFTLITGVDLAYEDLEGEWPEGFEAGPTENPEDEDVAMDPDEDLPWPDPALVTDWWSRHRERFSAGQRYLVGGRVVPEHLQWVLRHGMQRQRAAAALELKLLHAGEPLFETRAPGFAQQRALGSGM